MKILSLVCALFLPVTLSSALAAPFVSPEWEEIQAKILAEGQTSESVIGTTMYLLREKNNEKNYLTALVDKVDGQLRIRNISAVTEVTTSLPDGSRQVDQWIFWLGREVGELVTSAHFVITFNANNNLTGRRELSYGQAPTLEEHIRWQNTLGEWYEAL